MKAILVKNYGGREQLYIGEADTPRPVNGEILVRVKAAGLNRADILQREGRYPPPPGASSILGLEIAGTVEAMGDRCSRWKKGERICALLPGGGYAQYAVVHEEIAMPIPANLSFEQAAAIPEAFLTAFQALFWLGNLQTGYNVLIHAGASGVGSAAIQLVKISGAQAITTAGFAEKIQFCKNLGAELAINYKEGEFAPKVMDATGGRGVDVIIDFIGAPYWEQNVGCLASDGRIVILATMGGAVIEKFDLRALFKKRGQLITSSLRSRNEDYKIRLTRDFIRKFLPAFEAMELKPVVDRVFPWQQVADAHRYMEENRNMGKIVLCGDW
ncbi:MAG: NAD(P)H-quinone oxidoreductase [Calditrichia bacterium]